MKLAGKVAIVTGSGRGLGRAMALILAEEGADVVLTARTAAEIESAAAEVKVLGRKALAVQADVSSEEQVNRMVEQAVGVFGKIDILVNNAGGVLNAFRTCILDLSLRDWQEVLQANVTGTFLCTRAVLPHMIKRRSGAIINLTSIMGKKGQVGQSAYCAAKFGVEALTQVAALEAASFNIRVNALSPGGLTATPGMLKYYPRTPREKMLDPKVVRDLLIYLASDDCVCVTGQSFSANIWNYDTRELKHVLEHSENLKKLT